MKKQYKTTEEVSYAKEAPTNFYDGNLAIPLVEMTSFQIKHLQELSLLI